MSFFVNEPKNINTDAQGDAQVDVLSLPPLAQGANKIGKVEFSNTLSLLDSSTAVLGANATYTTATSFNISSFKSIVGTVFADQAGTLNVEQSWDGSNWDSVDAISVSAGAKVKVDVSVIAPNARVRYVNGATAQLAFRLYIGGKLV